MQTGFAKATQELESKVEDKIVFLSIIQQVRLPSVQIRVRMVEEIEQLEGKTYRELTMSQHLPDAKKIYSNTTDQTRTMAAFMYFVLYEQITSLKALQTGCSRDFQCLKLPKFQTSSTPPQVKNPRTTNHLYVPTIPKPILKGSNKLTRPPKKIKIQAILSTTPK